MPEAQHIPDDPHAVHLPGQQANLLINGLQDMFTLVRRAQRFGLKNLTTPVIPGRFTEPFEGPADTARERAWLCRVTRRSAERGYAALEPTELLRGVLNGLEDAGIDDTLACCTTEAEVAAVVAAALTEGTP